MHRLPIHTVCLLQHVVGAGHTPKPIDPVEIFNNNCVLQLKAAVSTINLRELC